MASVDVFECDPRNFELTDEMAKYYDDHGYILIKGFFDQEEMEQLRKTVEDSDLFREKIYGVSDGEGGESKLVLWSHPGNDVTGMIARCQKVAGTAEKLLGGEVYHYHTKLMTKPAKIGGKHIWHQDYGYWYKNGCLFPDMLSVFIPIDPCRKINGCLEILDGSHKCGRIDHDLKAGQQSCDLERLEHVRARCAHKYVEMDPGARFCNSGMSELHRPERKGLSGPQDRQNYRCACRQADCLKRNQAVKKGKKIIRAKA